MISANPRPPRAEATPAFEPVFGTRRYRVIHPVAGPRLARAFKPHAANRKLFPDQHRQIRPADQHIPAQNSGRNPRQSKLRFERFKHVRGEKRDLSFVAGTIPVKPIPFDAPTRAADDRRHLSRRMFAGGRTRSAEKIMAG